MGYKFKLKKQEREKLLREKCKSDMVQERGGSLFVRVAARYTVTYTCVLRKQMTHLIRKGFVGMLVADGERVVFWDQHGTLGYISKEDTAEVMRLIKQLPGEVPACLAEVVSGPTPFNTCQVQLAHAS